MVDEILFTKVVKQYAPALHKMYVLRSKLYTPSTLNIELMLWHTQLIVCAANVK